MDETTRRRSSWFAPLIAGAAQILAGGCAAPLEPPDPPAVPGSYHDGSPEQETAGTPGAARWPRVGLRTIAAGLVHPVTLVVPPDGSRRRFVVDQVGVIRIVTPDGVLLPEPFLDLRDRLVPLDPEYDERGLLGLAFHPDYPKNGRFFVYYSAPLRAEAPAGWDHTNRVSELLVRAGEPDRADHASERVVLAVDHPQMNHDGGSIVFGPDGYLYIPIGDGGGAGDRDPGHTPGIGNAQDRTNLLGKILRIDVNCGAPYGIPPDNPFVGQGGAAEIYAYGLRNPYQIAFDPAGARRLFAADAGQELWEEVDVIEKGGNYGWRIREGAHCFNPEDFRRAPQHCPATVAGGEPLRGPVLEIPNVAQRGGIGAVVVGGHVYRGKAMPELAGRYIFGVWSASAKHTPRGALLVARETQERNALWSVDRLVAPGLKGTLGSYLLGFGQDEEGEVYAMVADAHGPTGSTGKVLKLVPPSRK